ncbi:MAG: hypothetical protein ABSH06_04415 [Thermodesulfobacteriota bacterium]
MEHVPTDVKDSLASPAGSFNTDASLDQGISEVVALLPGSPVVSDSRSVIDRLKDEGVYEEYKAWYAKNPQNFEPGWRRRLALLRGRKQFEEWRR